jgi:hypothetical protein
MKKIIKKWGNGIGIFITKDDAKIYRLKKGDFVDIEFMSDPRNKFFYLFVLLNPPKSQFSDQRNIIFSLI